MLKCECMEHGTGKYGLGERCQKPAAFRIIWNGREYSARKECKRAYDVVVAHLKSKTTA